MLNIDINVTPGIAEVEKLNTKITELGATAQAAGKAISDNLKIKKNSADEVAALRKEYAAWSRTMATFKGHMSGTKELIEELSGNSLKLINATRQANGAIKTKVKSLKDDSEATKKLIDDTKKLAEAEKAAEVVATIVAKTRSQVMTYTEKYNKRLAELNSTAVRAALGERDYARAVEMTKGILGSAGTEIEKYTFKLNEQTKTFGKSKADLLAMKNGWKLLSDQERLAIVDLQNTADAFANVSGLINKTLSPLEKYNKQVADLNRVKPHITLEQYATGLKNARAELDKYLSKQDAASRALVTSIKETKDARIAMLEYTASTREAALNVARTDIEILKLTRGFSALEPAEKAAAIAARQLSNDMARVSNTFKQVDTPIQKHRADLAALNRLQKEGAITSRQYALGLDHVERELKESTAAQVMNNRVLRHSGSEYHLLAQATAAFRSGLTGANLGFNYFTSGTVVAATAAYGLTKAMKHSLTVGASFEQTFDRVAVVLGQFGANVNNADLTSQVDLVRAKVLELGETTQFTANQVAEAASTLAQAGMTGIEIYNALPAALNLAAIGMIGVAESADLVTNVMQQFQLAAKDADHIADVLAKTTVNTNINIQQLAKTLTYVGSTANVAGLSLEQTASAISVLANVGIKGSMAGTVLRRVITNIAAIKPDSKAAKSFRDLGIDIESVKDKGLDLALMFTQLKEKTKDMGAAARLTFVKDFFGQWAVTGAAGMALLAERFAKFEGELRNVQGTAEGMRKEVQANLLGAFETLTSVIENIGVKAFEIFGPEITAKIRDLTAYLNTNSAQIATSVGNAWKMLSGFISSVVEWSGVISKLAVGFTVFMVAKTAISALSGAFAYLSRAGVAYEAVALANSVSIVKIGDKAILTSAALKSMAASQVLVSKTQAAGAISNKAMGVGAGFAAFNIAKTGTEAVKAATGIGALGAMLGRAAGWLTGPWGMAIITVLTFLPMLSLGFEEVERSVYSGSEALKEYQAVAVSLESLSGTNLLSLSERLSQEAVFIKSKLKEIEDAIIKSKERQNDAANESARLTARFGMTGPTEEQLAADKAHNDLLAEKTRIVEDNNAVIAAAADTYKAYIAETIASKMGLDNLVLAYDALSPVVNVSEIAVSSFSTVLSAVSPKIAEALALLKDIPSSVQPVAVAFDMLKTKFSGVFDKIKTLVTLKKAEDEKAAGDAAAAAAAAKATAEISKQVSAFDALIKEYEKATGSTAELSRQWMLLNANQAFMASGSAEATAKLKELGITAAEAEAAFKWKKEDIATDFIVQSLSAVDVRFKDFAKTLAAVETKSFASGEALEFIRAKAMLLEPPLRAATLAMIDKLAPAIEATENNSMKLVDEFKKLSEEAALLQAQMGAPSGFDALVAHYKKAGGATTEFVIATIRAKEIFGDYKKTFSADQQLEEAAKVLKVIVDKTHDTGEAAAWAAKQYKVFEQSLPKGALLKENENLENQIALFNQGSDAIEIYNAAWAATGGHLDQLQEGFVQAKVKNLELIETLKQMEEVRGIYENFGESTARIFTDLFTGGIKSFKSFASRLKDSFKQLISDLLFMAIKNNIFKAMFNSGNGTNIFGGIIQGLGSLFTGGQAGAGSAGGGGTGFWGNLAGTIGSFFGGGQSTNTGTGAGSSGLNMGGLTSTAIQSFLGMGAGTASGGSYGTGSNWLNLISQNGFNSQQMVGYMQQILNPTMVSGLGALGVPMANAGMGAVSAYGPMATGYMGPGAVNLGYGTIPNYTGAATSMSGPAATPGSLGTAGTVMAGLAGAYYGYNRTNGGAPGVAAAVGYGALGIGAAGVLSGVASGAGAVAGGAGAFSAFGTSAIVPVVGWIVAAIAALDMVTGGKVFGTKFRPESASSGISISEDGGSAFATRTDVRNRSLFRGRQWQTVSMDAGPEARSAATSAYEDILKTMVMTAKELEVTNAQMIEARFETKATFDKKGKKTGETTTATIAGRTYKGIDFEEFMKRTHAETMIAVVEKSVEAMFESVTEVARIAGSEAEAKIFAIGDDFEGPGGPRGPGTPTTPLNEVQQLANRWRDDADLLVEGATLLVMAQNDIIDGNGLLAATYRGVLTDTVDLVEELQAGEETLSETYQRLKQSTALTEQTLSGFGVNIGRNREELVRFSAELVNSLGGMEAATQKLTEFMQAFGEISGLGDYQAQTARNTRESRMSALGLDPNLDAAGFAAQFQLNLPSMDAEDVGQWIEAGQALAQINNALAEMRKQAELSEDPVLEAQRAIDQQVEAIRRLGANEAELAEARAIGLTVVQRVIDQQRKELDEFMNNVEGELAQFEGREHVYALEQIRRKMNENKESARKLGASLAQLARIEQLAAYEMQKVIADLRQSITALVSQLYGSEIEGQVEGATSATNSYYESQLDGARELYEAEMERYNAAQEAIKQIDQYLRDLQAGPLSDGGWQERLGASETNFMEMFQRAMSGDVEAMGQLTQYADEYLQQAQDAYGPSVEYSNILQTVMSMLRQFQAYAATIEQPNPVTETGGGDSGGSSTDSGSSGTNVLLDAAQRYQLALQLAQQIGELGIALDTSVFSLMTEFGIDIARLARDLGIDVENLDRRMAINIGVMAGALGIGISALLTQLEVTAEDLAEAFGVTTSDYTQSNLDAILLMAEEMNIGVFEAMGLVGFNLQGLVESLGIDLDGLSLGMGESLVTLAGMLGVNLTTLMGALDISLVELAASFGLNVDSLNANSVTQLTALSTLLGTSIGALITQLGISIPALAVSFGIDITAMNANTTTQLVALATALDMSITELIDAVGINLTDVATAFGVDLTAVTGDMYIAFTNFANALGMDILELANTLGLDLYEVADQFVTAIDTGLDTLPDVPDDIKTLLAPYLQAIRDADTTEEVNSAVNNLLNATNLLPEDTRTQLLGLFTSLGLDINRNADGIQDTNVLFQKASIAAQNSIAENTAATVAAVNAVRDAITNSTNSTASAAAATVGVFGFGEAYLGSNYMSSPGITMPAEFEQGEQTPAEALMQRQAEATQEMADQAAKTSAEANERSKMLEAKLEEVVLVIEKTSEASKAEQVTTNEKLDALSSAIKRKSGK